MAKAAALLLIACAGAFSQQPLSFEVATVKPMQGYINAGGSSFGPRITLTGYGLDGLIMDAYQVESFRSSVVLHGCAPIRSKIVDKAPGSTAPSPVQSREMFRSLLADRFKLRVHREMREAPVYALVVAKNGPKLKKSTAADSSYTVSREMKFEKQTMASLALRLSSGARLGRPVLDKTGLTGEWDFTLTFIPKSSARFQHPRRLHRPAGTARTEARIAESAGRAPHHRPRRETDA